MCLYARTNRFHLLLLLTCATSPTTSCVLHSRMLHEFCKCDHLVHQLLVLARSLATQAAQARSSAAALSGTTTTMLGLGDLPVRQRLGIRQPQLAPARRQPTAPHHVAVHPQPRAPQSCLCHASAVPTKPGRATAEQCFLRASCWDCALLQGSFRWAYTVPTRLF